MDDPDDTKDDREADNESNILLDHSSEDSETPEQLNVSAAQKDPGSIWLIRWSKKIAEEALLTVNIMETRRNQGIKKM